MIPYKVLLADDHQDSLEILEIFINNHPQYEVVSTCSNGEELISNTAKFKPDIVITKKFPDSDKAPELYVIDTKWKIIDPGKPGDDDLKQMYAYNMYWNSIKSILLYPSSKPESTNFGKFHKGREKENLCKLGFVKVNNGKDLDPNIGVKVLELLELNS